MPDVGKEPALVFLSYARPDRERVRSFFDNLLAQGFDVWMDFLRIKAGQNWDFEIQRALDKAAITLVFISNNSVNRRGYVQREIKFALDKRLEKLIDDISLIPILLDDEVLIPEQVKDIHCVRASDPDCAMQIASAINHQLDRLGSHIESSQNESGVSWTRTKFVEMWDGLPGYEIEAEIISLHSELYRDVTQINRLFAGEVARDILRQKALKYHQDQTSHNFGQSKFWRTCTLDLSFSDPVVVGGVLSLKYVRSSYYAGAAHGGRLIQGWSFCLDPVLWIASPQELFVDPQSAFPVIQRLSRQSVAQGFGDDNSEYDPGILNGGTSEWSHFGSFVFVESGIEFTFQEYQVGCYADGTRTAEVRYADVWELMRPELVSALGLERLRWQNQPTSADKTNC